jgi:hypothetical protein
VYRHKYAQNLACKVYLRNTAFPYRYPLLQATGGAGYTRATATPGMPSIENYNISVGDILLHSDLGPVAVTGIGKVSGGQLQLSHTGDGSPVAGHAQLWVVGAGVNRMGVMPQAISFRQEVATAVTANGFRQAHRGGRYTVARGRLSGTLTGATAILVKIEGTLAGTYTIPSGQLTGTMVWVDGSGLSLIPDNAVTFDVTVGTGTAALTFEIDVA